MIKVVDIFAGPGGLSEGFSAVKDRHGNPVFDTVLSVEMDRNAFDTLQLRKFFRRFPNGAPENYYKFLRGEISKEALYEAYPSEIKETELQCWNVRLGPGGEGPHIVRDRIDKVVGATDEWVLLGGPPCQAYSLAGRSRNQANPKYDPNKDVRQRLYVEYLQILADHRPAVFIMENVKGLLSATMKNDRMFHRILDDLRSPKEALWREERSTHRSTSAKYRIYSLVERNMFENGDLQGSVIRAEKYGVPQTRHRVILLGVREDVAATTPLVLRKQEEVPVSSVLSQLPALRSGLSRITDSASRWKECLRSQMNKRWANAGTSKVVNSELRSFIRKSLSKIESPAADRGGEFVAGDVSSAHAKAWYCDKKIGGVCNHSSRAHMESDLYRYFYAACYAKLFDKSPTLENFPTDLLPDHSSVGTALEVGGNFNDRFRVQVESRPSTTVVSHISKDGHYYIHPDPMQCRSLTVREVARLQTFPDNYFFCGPKTAQYVQVGNAVPPYLAKQVGEIVLDLFSPTGASD